jgi:Gram-negative bacterial TonB protein C-terminal
VPLCQTTSTPTTRRHCFRRRIKRERQSELLLPMNAKSLLVLLIGLATLPAAMGQSPQSIREPTPSPPRCPVRDRPALWLTITVPAPSEARRLGISGQVFMVVSVDENGAATSAVVSAWNDPMFIEPALTAAKLARYAPEIRNCVPVPSVYSGLLSIPVPRQRERVDAIRYFPGVWQCGISGRETWRAIRNGVERVVESTTEEYVAGHWRRVNNPPEDFVRGDDAGWTFRRAGVVVAKAHPWIDERWTFLTGENPQPGVLQYQVSTERTYYRITASPGLRQTDRCERDSATRGARRPS